MHSIEFLTSSSIENIVAIHRLSMPEDVLPNLGIAFLSSYYDRICPNSTQLLFGNFSNGVLAGFCQLSLKPISIGKIALVPANTLRIIKLIFLKPRIFFSGVVQVMKMQTHDNGIAEIAFIAVLPEFQGQGIGSALINFANQQARSYGMTRICTKTSNPVMKNIYVSKYAATLTSSFHLMGKEFSLLTWPV